MGPGSSINAVQHRKRGRGVLAEYKSGGGGGGGGGAAALPGHHQNARQYDGMRIEYADRDENGERGNTALLISGKQSVT